MWCDLFKYGRVIGLDIDLSHIENNMSSLKSKGAFKDNQPELYCFDQFMDNEELLTDLFKERKPNIVIDDGFHSNEANVNTFNHFYPYLAPDFIYFIEDNKHVHKEIRRLYPHLIVDSFGELTVIYDASVSA